MRRGDPAADLGDDPPTRPPRGAARARRRFHPELTGRENVYLNASFLGLSRRQTDAAFDDIVAFAELEDFIDNEVKFYSSGMLVRPASRWRCTSTRTSC